MAGRLVQANGNQSKPLMDAQMAASGSQASALVHFKILICVVVEVAVCFCTVD